MFNLSSVNIDFFIENFVFAIALLWTFPNIHCVANNFSEWHATHQVPRIPIMHPVPHQLLTQLGLYYSERMTVHTSYAY